MTIYPEDIQKILSQKSKEIQTKNQSGYKAIHEHSDDWSRCSDYREISAGYKI